MLATIAAMPGSDRTIGERLHAIIKASAGPHAETLVRDARVCQGRQSRLLLPKRQKFKTRYATFGFMHEAKLDEGAMWPTAFAVKELTAAEEAKIAALVRKAVS